MLDRIPPAAAEVTSPAAPSAGMTDIFRDLDQVNVRFRHTGVGGCFFIAPGGVMTDQAVDLGHIGKVKILISPAVPRVTGCATSLVADGGNSVVVEHIHPFPVHGVLLMFHGVGGRPFPEPVGGFQHIFALRFMAAKTFPSHLIRTGRAGQFNQPVMVGYIFLMTAKAVHRPFVHLIMTIHAPNVVGGFQADPFRMFRVKGFLVTGGAAGCLQGIRIGGAIMMTGRAILCAGRVLGVHEPHGRVTVLLFFDGRAVQPEIGVWNIPCLSD